MPTHRPVSGILVWPAAKGWGVLVKASRRAACLERESEPLFAGNRKLGIHLWIHSQCYTAYSWAQGFPKSVAHGRGPDARLRGCADNTR